jgi:hypothetical protein
MYCLSKDPNGNLLFTKESMQKLAAPPPATSTVIRPHSKLRLLSRDPNIKFDDWLYDYHDTIMDIMSVITHTLSTFNTPHWQVNINEGKLYDVLAKKVYQTSYNKEKKLIHLFSSP